MAVRRDLIALVEACYDLHASEAGWLTGVADGIHDVLQPEHGVLAYHIDVEEQGFRIHSPVQSGATPEDMVARIETMRTLLESKRSGKARMFGRAKAKLYERVLSSAFRVSAGALLQSEHPRIGPDWMYNLGAPTADVFALLNHHIDGNGATGIFGGLTAKRDFRPAERAMYQMISAHIKAGLRLRRRLPGGTKDVSAPSGGAVLTGSGELLHAEGEATGAEERRELGEAAARIDRARSRASGRGEDALAVWHGLVRGRWSLVETFDTDGKRFMLAHRNPEGVRDPRGLTTMEARVVGLAVRGYSDKLIAYHLGLSDGTVSSHLASALRKLGMSGRAELVRQLGTRYPQPPL